MGWFRRRRDSTQTGTVPAPHAPAGTTHGCDVCSRDIRREDGFVLSTADVSASEEYWLRYFETSMPMVEQFLDADGLDVFVSRAISQVCEDPTAWLVCPGCVECFVVDVDEARRLARTGGDPDDLGPVAPGGPATIAARAWRHLTGSWPGVVRPEQEPIDACDACAKPMYTDEPFARIPAEKVLSFVDDGVLEGAPAATRPSSDGGAECMACSTCLARINARSRLRC